jgi:hypothetical protein
VKRDSNPRRGASHSGSESLPAETSAMSQELKLVAVNVVNPRNPGGILLCPADVPRSVHMPNHRPVLAARGMD